MWIPATVVTLPAAAIMAAADVSSGFDPLSLIGTAVTPVIVVLLFLTGQIVSKREYERALAAIETERQERTALQATVNGEVFPAITRSTDAVTRSTDLMERLARRQVGGD